MNIKTIISNNFLPKIMSLILAAATWFYIYDIVQLDHTPPIQESVEDVISRYKFSVKEVPVKPVFYGKSPSGYAVIFDAVRVTPSSVNVFGPEELMMEVDYLSTEPIDLAEYTRSVKLQLGLRSSVKALDIQDKTVTVDLPIREINKDAEKRESKPKI